MSEHSKYSASGFEAALLCPGKRVMEHGRPDTSGKHAAWGTVAHGIAAARHDGVDYPVLGTVIEESGFEITVDAEMIECVSTYLANVATIVAGGMSLAEQRVNYSAALGVPTDEAWGTADILAACGLAADELQVHDLKTGMGVEVDAENNVQMMLYGLGALDAVQGILGDFNTVRLVIHQPRIKDAPSEWVISVPDLQAWAATEGRRAIGEMQGAEQMHASKVFSRGEWERIYLRPNEKSCRFCKAKSTCPALRDEVASTVMQGSVPATPDEFESIQNELPPDLGDSAWLAACMSKADLIDDWLKAVRAEVERRLLTGGQVPGFKIVQGKRGNRAWRDAAQAEEALKGMRLKVEEMYDLKLISPTSAEKLAPKFDKAGKALPPKEGAPAPLIGPRQWPKLAALITQSEGKPHVAPASDPRPAMDIKPAADDFDEVPTTNSVDEFA